VDLKVLVAGEAGPSMNFTLALTLYGQGDETFQTPRHHHTFEQVRYAISGDSNYARGKDIPEGWVGFFPAGAFYGPQKVAGGEILLLQYGPGYLTEEQKRRGQQEMAATGTFHDGIYTTTDAATGKPHNQDAVEALWEHIHGEPLRYPAPCYPEPILINPEAFTWVDCEDGVAERPLGRFGNGDARIAFVRVDAGASYTLDDQSAQVAFSTAGRGAVRDEVFGPRTALFSELGERATFTAAETITGLVVGFPRL
jgi:hypothetical protein